jgi:hypothetical protein
VPGSSISIFSYVNIAQKKKEDRQEEGKKKERIGRRKEGEDTDGEKGK